MKKQHAYTCNRTFGDIYGHTAHVITDKPLANMPGAQAGVIIEKDGHIKLISYCTVAASIDPAGYLTVDCLVSATTRRHVSAFLAEYCPDVSYRTAKALYESGDAMNVRTGEVIPAA